MKMHSIEMKIDVKELFPELIDEHRNLMTLENSFGIMALTA